MDYIERLVGISPDGGSGAFELLLFMLAVFGVYVIYRSVTVWTKRRN